MLFTVNESVISYCNCTTPQSFSKHIFSVFMSVSLSMFPCNKVHLVTAYLDTISMTLDKMSQNMTKIDINVKFLPIDI